MGRQVASTGERLWVGEDHEEVQSSFDLLFDWLPPKELAAGEKAAREETAAGAASAAAAAAAVAAAAAAAEAEAAEAEAAEAETEAEEEMEAEAASTPLPVPLPPPHRQLVTLSTLDARGASKAKKRQREGDEPDGAAIVARDRMLFAAPGPNAAVASLRPRRSST